MKKVLTIAGSDSSGGAGIQADLKTFTVHNTFGMSVITALTAQNTMGVQEIFDVSPEFVEAQLDSVFKDIKPDAVKIGMVSNKEVVEVIVKKLKEYKPKNIVIDPVMVATSGSTLMKDSASEILVKKLLPLATLITPNIDEAKSICGYKIDTYESMVEGAKSIYNMTNSNVLIKGGHFGVDAKDLYYDGVGVKWYSTKRIENPNTHGTGCTLSSAIASNLALENTLEKSIELSKEYITKLIKDKLDIGNGRGPLNHMAK